jgi:hypothetical protein
MIFNRTTKFNSQKQSEIIERNLLGQKTTVHKIDFEIVESHDVLKIIPHTEEEEGILTLPICSVMLNKNNNSTDITIKSHPRKIDIGGPYILLILIAFAIITGIVLGTIAPKEYGSVSKWMLGLGLTTFALFWLRMELGYFDYVRKINKWVKTLSI